MSPLGGRKQGREGRLAPGDVLPQKASWLPLSGGSSCCFMASRKASSLASFFWFRASYSSLGEGRECVRAPASGSAPPALGPHLFLMMRWTMRSVVRSLPLSIWRKMPLFLGS